MEPGVTYQYTNFTYRFNLGADVEAESTGIDASVAFTCVGALVPSGMAVDVELNNAGASVASGLGETVGLDPPSSLRMRDAVIHKTIPVINRTKATTIAIRPHVILRSCVDSRG